MGAPTAKTVIEQFLASLAGGDAAAIKAIFTDDAVIDMPGSADLPWAGRWQGRAKIDEYFEVMPSVLEIRKHEHKIWVAEPDTVAVTGTEVAASRLSGKEYTAKWCWVFQVRGGKIALWDAYEDTEAMASCGPWR